MFELELRKCTSRTRPYSKSCRSVLLVLGLCYKVMMFELELQKCTSCSRLVLAAEVYFAYWPVLQSCDF